MTRRVEKITLKRLGKKLWQYAEKEPKRIELATLDYLIEQGWRGYFSEYFNYDHTLLIMMCWCNRESYFQEKRKSLRVESIKDAFNSASDGYWSHYTHKLSHADLMHNARTFSEDMIPRILDHWQTRGVKSTAVGFAHLKPRSADELNAEDLVSFYNARGGLQYFIDYLEYFHGAECQQLKSRARNIHQIFTISSCEYNLISRVGGYLGIHGKINPPPTPENIQDWIDDIHKMSSEAKNTLLELALDVKKYWYSRKAIEDKWTRKAYLDLEIWKESVANVEVKAPNDRLQPHQIEQLALDEAHNRTSWVIEVLAV